MDYYNKTTFNKWLYLYRHNNGKMLLISTTFYNSTLDIYDIVSMTYSFNFQG